MDWIGARLVKMRRDGSGVGGEPGNVVVRTDDQQDECARLRKQLTVIRAHVGVEEGADA
jgi:hypothetical protein